MAALFLMELFEMKKVFGTLSILYLLLLSCNRDNVIEPMPYDNPEILRNIPSGFPPLNPLLNGNKPTKFGVELGKNFLTKQC